MPQRLLNRLGDQHGYVMVTAIVLTTIMVSIGLVAAALIDNGTRRVREDRERETALMVDEGVLYAQSLVMQTAWPTGPGLDSNGKAQYFPNRCDLTTGLDSRCPNPETLAAANSGTPASAAFGNVDASNGGTKDLTSTSVVKWATKVRDNGVPLATAYDPTKADQAQPGCARTPCTYDANGDRELWVQSQTYVRGKPRNVVARLRLEQLAESIPQTAVVAGALSITNNGNHGGTPIIDAKDSQVIVRCPDPSTNANCANFESGQIVPGTPQPDGTAPNMMSPEQLQRFKQRAIMDRTYYPGCPTDPYNLAGKVVWVEGCVSPPNLTNRVPTVACPNAPAGLDKDCVNTEDNPGLLIWHCGMADMAGGWTYRGVLYIVNNSDGTCAPPLQNQRGNGTCSNQPNATSEDAITTNGGFGVWGAVAVDGPACLKLGSNGIQVSYDKRVFDAVESYGTVGLVQNTWREIEPKAF